MNEQLIVHLIGILFILVALTGISIIIAATWYDLRMIRFKKQLPTLTAAIAGRRQPSITVLVYTRNAAASLVDCLESILRNNYASATIVVADNNSTDSVKKVITAYKRSHPEAAVLAYHKKTSSDRWTTLHQAYKKASRSDIVLTMDATDRLSSGVLQECAVRLSAHEGVDAITLRPLPAQRIEIQSLAAHFYLLTKNMLYKALPRVLSAFDLRNTATAMTSDTFVRSAPITRRQVYYAAEATYIQTSELLRLSESKSGHKTHHTRKRRVALMTHLFALIAILSMITYFVYTAATLQSDAFLTLSWTIVCLWLLAVTWSDDTYKLGHKLQLSFTVPFMYFLLYVQLLLTTIRILIILAQAIPRPSLRISALRDAMQLELYSTRF